MAKGENPKENKLKKLDFFLIGFILLVGLFLRLYKIDSPLADWHSWRQVDTAAVARNFVRSGFDLLHPHFDDFSNAQSSFYNPSGFRFVEFPLYSVIFALVYKIAPVLPIEIYGRLTTIFFSLLIVFLIYYLVFKEEGRIAATSAAVVFSIFPFFVFYSRVVLPDMTATSLIFLGLTFLILWSRENRFRLIYLILSGLVTACAILIKPTVIFFLISSLYVFYKKLGLKMFKEKKIYFFFMISILPFILWRLWIRNFPEGIPVSIFLITSIHTGEGTKSIFLRPAFFRWIFQERILNLILGGYLTVFFILGILKKPKKNYFFLSVLVASFLYVFTFQGGNVQHDYYQILILPALAIFTGLGVKLVFEEKKVLTNSLITISITILIFVSSFLFSFYGVQNFYSYSTDVVNISKIIKTVTLPQDIIVTDTTGDTTLLYLSDRKGFPLVSEGLGDLKKRGAKYFVTQKKEVAKEVRLIFKLIFESDKVYIFRL